MPTIAVAWFRREDYDEIRRISVDDGHPSFDEWERRMNVKLKALEQHGVKLEKVIIKPAELQAWASERSTPIDSQARAGLAAVLLARRSMN